MMIHCTWATLLLRRLFLNSIDRTGPQIIPQMLIPPSHDSLTTNPLSQSEFRTIPAASQPVPDLDLPLPFRLPLPRSSSLQRRGN